MKSRATLSKSPVLRVCLPSRRCQPFRSWKPLRASHAPGLHPSELFSGPAAHPWFPTDDPPRRFRANPIGLAPALRRFPLAQPAVLPALPRSYATEWSRCSPESFTFRAFLRRARGEASLFPAPLPFLVFPASEETGKRNLRGIPPTVLHLPSFEGRRPAWCFNRLHPPLL